MIELLRERLPFGIVLAVVVLAIAFALGKAGASDKTDAIIYSMSTTEYTTIRDSLKANTGKASNKEIAKAYMARGTQHAADK